MPRKKLPPPIATASRLPIPDGIAYPEARERLLGGPSRLGLGVRLGVIVNQMRGEHCGRIQTPLAV